MNFPMEYPIFQFLYWLVNTAGVGGIAAAVVAGVSLGSYALTLRWIARGSRADEQETYDFPTPAFKH